MITQIQKCSYFSIFVTLLHTRRQSKHSHATASLECFSSQRDTVCKKRSCTNVSVVRVAIRLFPLPKGLFQFRFSKRFGVQTTFLRRHGRELNQFMFLFLSVLFLLVQKKKTSKLPDFCASPIRSRYKQLLPISLVYRHISPVPWGD